MGLEQRSREEKFSHEVPILNRIEAVLRNTFKPKRFGELIAIDLEWVPCQRPGTQRTNIRPCANFSQTADVTFELTRRTTSASD